MRVCAPKSPIITNQGLTPSGSTGITLRFIPAGDGHVPATRSVAGMPRRPVSAALGGDKNNMKILCQIFSVIVATLLSCFVSINPLHSFVARKWGHAVTDNLFFILLGLFGLLFSGLTVAANIFISTSSATVIISTVSFALATYAYFSLQRFTGPIDQPFMISKNPLFYPFIIFLTFVVAAITGGILIAWYFFIGLIGIWFVLGFACAEMAIQAYMKRSSKLGTECDRDLAIFAVTKNAKGQRNMFAKRRRYPFP